MAFYCPNILLTYDYDDGVYSEQEFFYMKEKLPRKLRQQIIDIANNKFMFRLKEIYIRVRKFNTLLDKERAYEFSRYLVDYYENKNRPEGFYSYPL